VAVRIGSRLYLVAGWGHIRHIHQADTGEPPAYTERKAAPVRRRVDPVGLAWRSLVRSHPVSVPHLARSNQSYQWRIHARLKWNR
jgi:hypothetical protein